YTITGPGLAHVPIAERSGTVTFDSNGHAVVTVHTLADLVGSGTTTIDIAVGTQAAKTVTIDETAFQTVTPSALVFNEGQSVTFTIDTKGVNGGAVAGQSETWTLTGAGTNQVTGGVLSGTVTLNSSGSAT